MALAITGERTSTLEEAIKVFAKTNNRTANDVLVVAVARYIKFDLSTLPAPKRDTKRAPTASDVQKLLASGDIAAAMQKLEVMENIAKERKERAAKKASEVTTTTVETVKADVETVSEVEVAAS